MPRPFETTSPHPRPGGFLLPALTGAIFLFAIWLATAALSRLTQAGPDTAPLDADHLYQTTRIWNLHLHVAPDQWEAMQPPGRDNPFGPGPRPPGRPGNGVNERALASIWMREADANRDGSLTLSEWTTYARATFDLWRTHAATTLDADRIREALDAIPNPVAEGITALLIGPEGKPNGIGTTFGLEFAYVHADLEINGHRFPNVGLRYKGNGTFLEARDSPKKSFKIQLDHFVPSRRLRDVETLNLQNQITDASYMNEVLAYRLYRDAGVPAPRTTYARVHLTVPGRFNHTFLGLYTLTEAVDQHFLLRHFATKRGALFKPVTSSLFADLGADWDAYRQIYDPKPPLFPEQKRRLIQLCHLLTHADDPTLAARIHHYIDLPQFARFLAVMVYLSDIDGLLGPGQNFYLHLHPKSQLFQFIPWDQDRSWGQFDRASQQQRDELSIHQPWQGRNPFLERMFRVQKFKQLYLRELDRLSQTLCNPDRIAAQVDEIAAAIRPAVREESEQKLATFDRIVAGELIPRPSFGPFNREPLKPIKPFVRDRTESIRKQLAGLSPGLQPGEGFSFGPPGRRRGSGLGSFAEPLFSRCDQDANQQLTAQEFVSGMANLFHHWDTNRDDRLRFLELYAGIQTDLQPEPPRFAPFGGPPPASRRNPPASPPGASPTPDSPPPPQNSPSRPDPPQSDTPPRP